jgi:hypothetical protein
MADKFHIRPKRVYEIWDNKERLQQGLDQPALDKNFQTIKIEQILEVVSEVSLLVRDSKKRMVEKRRLE